VAIAQNVGNGFTWGIGMYGVAGMGVDYADQNNYTPAAGMTAAGNAMAYATSLGITDPATLQQIGGGGAFAALAQDNFNMKTTLQLMQFAIPVAYTTNGFTFGIAPVVQYGSLDINYNILNSSFEKQSGSTQGVSQDFGLGYSVGVALTEQGLTLGAVYKSAINMTYDGVISNAMSDFTQGQADFSDDLEQPAEYGVGASYTMDGHTIALDYKRIDWDSANGYSDFGWQDQDVYAIGYQYGQDNWAVRLGYNYAESAVTKNSNTTLNTLNLLGFPATVESHYTVGGSYALNKTTSFDLAYIYAEASDESYNNMLSSSLFGDVKTTTKHTQDAVSAQLNLSLIHISEPTRPY